MYQFVVMSAIMFLGGAFCNKKKYDKIYLVCFSVIFMLMAALRGRWIGSDTHTYLDLFAYVERASFVNGVQLGRWEKGYLLFNKALSLISTNPQIIIIVSSIISFGAIYRFIKNESKCYWISMILFFVNGSFRFSIDAIRQMLAMSLLLLALSFLKEKKYIQYFLIAIMAFFFHASSIIIALILFVCMFEWKKRMYILGGILAITILLFESVFLNLIEYAFDYSTYIGSIYDDGINVASIFLALMCASCFAVMKLSGYYNSDSFFLKTEFVRLCILVVAFRLNVIDRLANYFMMFEIVGVTNALFGYRDKRTRQILVICIVSLYILYSYVWGIMRPSIQTVWPYKTFWM